MNGRSGNSGTDTEFLYFRIRCLSPNYPLSPFMAVIGAGSGGLGSGNGRDRQSHDFPQREFDAAAIIGIVLQELAGIFTALAETFALEREPCAAFVDDVFVDGKVDEVALARYAFAVHDVEFGFTERRRNFVLDDFHFGPASDNIIAILDGSDSPHVRAHRYIEFQGTAAGGCFRVAEHDADLFANLIDEDQACFRF